jgi:hypothetical protein
VIGVVLAFALTGGGGNTPTASRTAAQPGNTVAPPPGATAPKQAQTARGETTVAVLNGTTVSGLAQRVADKVVAAGFKKGTVDNATEQNRSATMVQFAPNARRQALSVAKVIGVGSDAISQLDQNTRTVAGDDAQVVVTVGADQNQGQTQG